MSDDICNVVFVMRDRESINDRFSDIDNKAWYCWIVTLAPASTIYNGGDTLTWVSMLPILWGNFVT